MSERVARKCPQCNGINLTASGKRMIHVTEGWSDGNEPRDGRDLEGPRLGVWEYVCTDCGHHWTVHESPDPEACVALVREISIAWQDAIDHDTEINGGDCVEWAVPLIERAREIILGKKQGRDPFVELVESIANAKLYGTEMTDHDWDDPENWANELIETARQITGIDPEHELEDESEEGEEA